MHFALLCLLAAMPAQAAELRVGAAAVSITPARGTPMAGYYSARGAQGVHDDLYAKAIVLDDGQTRAALVALDLISTTRDLVEDARRAIAKTTKVRDDLTMISATHTHTGPLLRGRGAHAADLGGETDLARRYRDELPAKIAEAVRQAEARLAPAKAFAGHGHEPSIAFNRRFHMQDGTVGWNPGKLNPKILKAAGTIDPDVPIVYFESAEGKPLATYVNYAVHLDNVGGTVVSADMPYFLGRALAEFQGAEMLTVWTAGCCGDVNHIDVAWAGKQHGFDNAGRMGVILAGAVLRAWPHLKPVESVALRSRSETVSLPLPELQSGDVEKARAIVERGKAQDSTGKPTFLESVWAYKTLDVAAREGRPQEVEVQAIALGKDVAWVSLPGEIFVELGLSIKQDSPFPCTAIAELANGAIGYVPARRAYAQGNYEVVSARCAEGSGERLVDAAGRLLKGLYAP
jgi:hypothetical protein